MARVYKIAVIQLHPKPLAVESNYAKAESFIRKAASQGAELAVLPEYHLTSWVPSDPKFISACSESSKYLEKYKALASELSVNIVPGTLIEVHDDAAAGTTKLYNIAYFVSSAGEVLGSYTKKNLWHPERPHLTSSGSDPHRAIQTPLGPVGLLICWDLAFPEAFRELISQGAKIIIVPTFWTLSDSSEYGLSANPLCEKLFLESTTVSRAFENTCAVVFVNAGGPAGREPEGTYAGLSRVAVPFLGALGEETRDNGREGMSVVELDMELLEEAEKNYKVREDMNRSDWHYSYRHEQWNETETGKEGL